MAKKITTLPVDSINEFGSKLAERGLRFRES